MALVTMSRTGDVLLNYFGRRSGPMIGTHLIFVDIMVPEIQGHDVLRLIRETEQKEGIPIEQKAKIIMTTSLSDAENIIEAFKATCDSYLVKPIRKAKLINEIESLGLFRKLNKNQIR